MNNQDLFKYELILTSSSNDNLTLFAMTMPRHTKNTKQIDKHHQLNMRSSGARPARRLLKLQGPTVIQKNVQID